MQQLLAFIIHPMEVVLVDATLGIGNAGIAIILSTIAVRLILSPLQIVQLRNAKAMRRVQPLVKELQKAHANNRQELTEATMAVYKEHKVSPALGCFPGLVQFPILLGLYYALLHLGLAPHGYPHNVSFDGTICNSSAVRGWSDWFRTCYGIAGMANDAQHVWDLFHTRFLWLSQGLGVSDPLFVLPVLAGIAQWVQSRMMLVESSDPQQEMMNNVMNFMPILIIIIAARNPSGLSLYWITSTIVGIAIQYRTTGLGLLSKRPWNSNRTQRPQAGGMGRRKTG